MLARVDPTLDRPVILFHDVIEILHGAVLAVVGQIACGLEHGNSGWISGVLVAVDDPRLRMVFTAQDEVEALCTSARQRFAAIRRLNEREWPRLGRGDPASGSRRGRRPFMPASRYS